MHFQSPSLKKKLLRRTSQQVLTSASSSSLLGSVRPFKESPQDLEQSVDKSQNQVQKKQKKIKQLQQRIKKTQQIAQNYKSKCASLEHDLHFFKTKIKEEAGQSTAFHSEIEALNSVIQNLSQKFQKLIARNENILQQFSDYHQDPTQEQTDDVKIRKSQMLAQRLQFQIQQLSKYFYVVKKQPENQTASQSATDARIEQYKKIDEIQKQCLRNQIKQLMELNESKIKQEEQKKDYQQLIDNLREQRQYNNKLLISSQTQKISYFNKIYKLARKHLNVDFDTMTKAELIRLCLQMFSQIQDLQYERTELSKQFSKMQIAQKVKYDNLLKSLRQIEMQSSKLKRLGSLNSA